METVKDILNFCNAAVFQDFKNIGITSELNQVRKGIINSFYKTIPDSRIRVSLSINDDIILKINNNDIEDILENIHDLRENILYMLSFEKFVRDALQTDRPILNEDDNRLNRICNHMNGCNSKRIL